jgi:hypothetical protein
LTTLPQLLRLRLASTPRDTRGRPLGTVYRPAFRLFVGKLLTHVHAAGGKLTLDTGSGSGSLPKAIDLLAPHLPPYFVPKALPVSTLQRIKTNTLRVLKKNQSKK